MRGLLNAIRAQNSIGTRLKSIITHISLVTLLLLGGYHACAYGQNEGHDHDHDSGTSTLNKIVKTRKLRALPPNFVKFKSYFKDICEHISIDGRLDPLLTMLNARSERDPECVGCKPFFSPFVSSCREQKKKDIAEEKKKKKLQEVEAEAAKAETSEAEEGAEGEAVVETVAPPPKPLVAQNDPSTVLIDTISRLFTALTESEKDLPQTYKVVMKVCEDFRSAANKTEEDLLYFSTLAEYIEAPFLEYREKARKEKIAEEEESAEDETETSRDPASHDEFFN